MNRVFQQAVTTTAESLANLSDETGPTLSWRDAEPFVISPRLRRFGKHGGKGPTRAILDHTAEKAALARMAQEQARQIAAAREYLARNERMRLSSLGQLEFHAFDLFLDLLGEALTVRRTPDESIETQSSDGLLTILLEPTSDETTATLQTRHGVFRGADHFITIRRTYAAAAA